MNDEQFKEIIKLLNIIRNLTFLGVIYIVIIGVAILYNTAKLIDLK